MRHTSNIGVLIVVYYWSNKTNNKRRNSVCANTFVEIYFPSPKKSKLPSHQAFGVFAREANGILHATPPKSLREMGMCGTAAIIIYLLYEYS